MLVLRLEREIYRDLYWMENNDPDLGKHFGNTFDDFGDKIKFLENTRIIALSQLGTKIWIFFWNIPWTSHPVGKAINTELQTKEDESLYSLARIASWSAVRR
ncbi:hypothetical protein AVEN_148694-1 [Araneus ventricosus]|uniref:Uncharacterized protein n=1 Tax=Araneus ventricosus TaxID=182803 RepID=A0A4Y2FRN9_ARAVE|nr:hypothetical protein AVEN_148694-1 [Araneus ventricosus]